MTDPTQGVTRRALLAGSAVLGFMRDAAAHAHEFFCPMDALTAEDGAKNPALRALLARASSAANYMEVPQGPSSAGPGRAARAAQG